MLLAGPPNGATVLQGLLPAHQAGLLTLVGVVSDETLASKTARDMVDRQQRPLLRRAAEKAAVPVVEASKMRERSFALKVESDWRPDLAIVLDSCSRRAPQRVQNLPGIAWACVRTLFQTGDDSPALQVVQWNSPSEEWKAHWRVAALVRAVEAQPSADWSGFSMARQPVVVAGEALEGIVTWEDSRLRDCLKVAELSELKLFMRYGRYVKHGRLAQRLPSGAPAAHGLEALNQERRLQPAEFEKPDPRAMRRSLGLQFGVQRELAEATAELIIGNVKSLPGDYASLLQDKEPVQEFQGNSGPLLRPRAK
jgi:hypothetical protein